MVTLIKSLQRTQEVLPSKAEFQPVLRGATLPAELVAGGGEGGGQKRPPKAKSKCFPEPPPQNVPVSHV